jgi:hypothetical protein
MFSWLCF